MGRIDEQLPNRETTHENKEATPFQVPHNTKVTHLEKCKPVNSFTPNRVNPQDHSTA